MMFVDIKAGARVVGRAAMPTGARNWEIVCHERKPKGFAELYGR